MFLSIFVNELTYLVVLLVIGLYGMVRDGMELSSRYSIFGYFLIVLVALSIVFNLSVGLYEAFTSFKEIFCKKKKMVQQDTPNPYVRIHLIYNF
jgi:predicted membrane protein